MKNGTEHLTSESNRSSWKRQADQMLLGLLLSLISLWDRVSLLSLPGLVLSYLGLRRMRPASGYFSKGEKWTLARIAIFLIGTGLDATIYRNAGILNYVKDILFLMDGLLLFMTIFDIWQGMVTVAEYRGLPIASRGVNFLFFSIAFFLLIGLTYRGLAVVIPLLGLAAFPISKCYRLSRGIHRTGYQLTEAIPRFSDRRVIGVVFGMTALTITLGLLFFRKHSMKWRVFDISLSEEAVGFREELAQRGYPRELLTDLREEEILMCRNAKRVFVTASFHSMENLYDAPRRIASDKLHADENLEKRLVLTGVAVELPDERPSWQIFHHFLWKEDPGFVGTEAIRIRTGRADPWWSLRGRVDGRVFYENDGKTFVSDRIFIEEGNFKDVSSGRIESCAAFSFPNEGERQRGYVTYRLQESGLPNAIIDCPIDYIHQSDWKQFPVMTAEEYAKRDFQSFYDVFQKTWDSIQFYPKDVSER